MLQVSPSKIASATVSDAALKHAIKLVKEAGYRVTKVKEKKKSRVGPTFVARFADGTVTRMSMPDTRPEPGIICAGHAYRNRHKMKDDAPIPPVVYAYAEQDNIVLVSYDWRKPSS